MRLLTKSRFKQALECPNKLYYTRKKEYVDKKKEDPFLEALADGGFQVEELARLHYPGGHLVDSEPWEYQEAWTRTQELLQQENVIIYEAAFMHDGLFIRTDILVKKGDYIKLIEVKSKTFDPSNQYLLIGKKGGIVKSWKPYLMDIAFQKYVMTKCFPQWQIDSYLMLADKTKKATIDGLNQNFRITKKDNSRTGIRILDADISNLGDPVLGIKNVSKVISDIEEGTHITNIGKPFLEAIEFFKEHYLSDTYAAWETTYSACKNCQYKADTERTPDGKKSGFHECFKKYLSWTPEHFARPNTLDVWDFRSGGALMKQGLIFKDQLSESDIKLKEEPEKISRTHRQWIQIQKDIDKDDTPFLLKDELAYQMSTWKFPLNFIDFETNTVALPFHKGRKPYETIAFQYSHHILYKDGRVDHAAEYINSTAGEFPNFQFLRHLKASLSVNEGSIFRYTNHENSVLNAIYAQLRDSDESDKEELMGFIQHITHSKKGSVEKWKGERDMIDQWDILKKYYYNPLTKGSNSLKYVLPAVLNSDKKIQKKYAQPIQDINITSINFAQDHIWLVQDDQGQVINPYQQLPPLFGNWSDEMIELTLSEMKLIGDGGAAMIAYAKLQYADMSEEERQEISKSLLRYCELDTLAMIILHEHFHNLTTA